MSEVHIFIALAVFLWLLICIKYDLKTREIPNLITIPPLLISLGVGIFLGYWAQIVYVIYLFLISGLPKELRPACGFIGLFLGASIFPENTFLFGSFFLFWSLWSFNVLGGADVKILMTLIIVTQAHSLGIYILLAGGAIGIIYLIRKQATFPYTLPITVGSLFYYLLNFNQ